MSAFVHSFAASTFGDGRQALTLRSAQARDTDFLMRLEAGSSPHLRTRDPHLPPLAPDMARSLAALLLRGREEAWRLAWPRARCLVLEVSDLQADHDADQPSPDTGPPGAPLGRLWIDDSSPTWRLLDITLLPGKRQRGLGSDALRAWLQHADAAQAAVQLNLNESSPALRLMRRLGFAVTQWRPPTVHLERPPCGAPDGATAS